MFYLIPTGHDRSVYGMPWVTVAIAAICVVMFFGSWGVEQSALEGARIAHANVQAVLEQHPDACVAWVIEGLPKNLAAEFQPPVCGEWRDGPSEGDPALDAAARELLAQLNRVPVLRLGYRAAHPSAGTMLASLFMHGGLMHLLGNMLFLGVAGTVIEPRWRRLPFAALFLVSGIAGTLMHHASDPDSLVPLVGASGGISGLLGAFLINHPRTRVRFSYFVWIFLFMRKGTFLMPAWACIPLWALQQLHSAVTGADDGVAYLAHVGGFVVGVAAAFAMRRLDWLEVDFEEYERAERENAATALPAAAVPAPDPARRVPPARAAAPIPLEPIPLEPITSEPSSTEPTPLGPDRATAVRSFAPPSRSGRPLPSPGLYSVRPPPNEPEDPTGGDLPTL